MENGVEAIEKERRRQIEKFDLSDEQDDNYKQGELLLYAQYWMTSSSYALDEAREDVKKLLQGSAQNGWGDECFKYYKRTPIERLARAGALIAAEIDRLYRLDNIK